MKTHSRSHLPKALAVVFLLSAGLQPAAANDLQSVRTGYHRSYSRVVVQFAGAVRYRLTTNPAARTITIKVEGVDHINSLRRVAVAPKDAILDAVRFFKDADRLTITTVLKIDQFKVIDYALHWPFRIVLDIQKRGGTQTAPAAVGPQSEVPATASAPDPDSSHTLRRLPESARVSIPEEVLKHTRPPLILRKAANQAVQKGPVNRIKTARGLVFWVIGAAFVLLDAMLLVLYLNRRKAARRQAAASRNPARNPASRSGRRKLQVAPPPNPQEFVHLLKEALARDEAEAGVPAAPALAKVMAPVAFAGVNAAEASPPAPPDFKEIALELYPELADDALTEENARQQLIGRDGVDFMKNVKRLYLN